MLHNPASLAALFRRAEVNEHGAVVQNIDVIVRIVHIFAAVTAAGAAFYQLIAVRPALMELEDDLRRRVAESIARRWFSIVLLLIVLLLATGLYNFIAVRVPELRGKPNAGLYHALFGIKFLVVLASFHAATVLSLPGPRGDRWRAKSGFWLPFLATMFATAIVIGVVLSRFESIFDK